MKLHEAIHQRRSIRKFQDRPVEHKQLEELVKAGAAAPNGRGWHNWKFTVIETESLIDQLAALIADKLDLDKDTYRFYGAKALILVSDKKDDPNCIANCAVAMENILLQVHGLGLGAVWINQLRTLCEDEDVRALLTKWHIPTDHHVGGIAAIGYPEGELPVKEKPIHVEYF